MSCLIMQYTERWLKPRDAVRRRLYVQRCLYVQRSLINRCWERLWWVRDQLQRPRIRVQESRYSVMVEMLGGFLLERVFGY